MVAVVPVVRPDDGGEPRVGTMLLAWDRNISRMFWLNLPVKSRGDLERDAEELWEEVPMMFSAELLH